MGCGMRKGIHPDYHFVTVALNDGTSYRTRTTWGESDAKMTLDIDPTTHPAWTGVRQSVDRGGRVQRFKDRFGMTGSGVAAGTKSSGAKPAEDAKPAKAAAKKK